MSLEETKKDLEKQLEEALKREGKENEEPADAPDAEDANVQAGENAEVTEGEDGKEPVLDKPEPEQKQEPVKEEPKSDDVDPSAYARLRRQLAEERRARMDAEEALARPKVEVKQPLSFEVEERAKPVSDPEIEQIKATVRRNNDEKALMRIEDDFQREQPDYLETVSEYKKAIYFANKTRFPRASHADIIDLTTKEILDKANNAAARGYNPAEQMFEEAKLLGLKPQKKEIVKEEAVKEEPKPDLRKIQQNKSRNAGTAAAKGAGSSGIVSREAASTMTSGEWMKLPKSERQRILRGG